jgi:integrase
MNTVEAVSKNEIAMIHTLLEKNNGQIYADIWKFGVNASLRISDLLKLKYSDCDLNARLVKLVEEKTGKAKEVRLNDAAIAVITLRKQEHPNDVWLFQAHSNRNSDKPIARESVARAFKEVGNILGLTISTHSMRKSRGKAMYDDGVPIEKIAKVLNHSNTTSTLRYLGIERNQVLQTYDDYQL